MKSYNPPTCEEIEALLPAAAAGALDPDETALVQAHVGGCARCLPLLAEYEGLIEQLAYAVPQVAPPPQVFERLMAAVTAPAPAGAPVIASPVSTAAPAPVAAPAPRAVPATPRPAAPAAPRRRLLDTIFGVYRRLAPVGLAAALVLLALTAGWAASLNSQVDEQNRLIAMLRMPGSQAVALEPMTTPAATGVAYMVPGYTEMGLMVSHLMPRPGRVYQVWLLMEDGRLVPCGTVEVDDMGVAMTRIRLPVDAAESRGIIITDEPPGPVVAPSGTKWLEADYH